MKRITTTFALLRDLFQAGTESVADTLVWGFYYMLKHPTIQEKVQQELDAVVGPNHQIKIQDRHKLPYTGETVKTHFYLKTFITCLFC